MRIYRSLLRLYPSDVRYAYAHEMQESFAERLTIARSRGRAALALWAARSVCGLLIDVAAERVSALHSHRSFHGRRQPDLGMVRPPNMSKAEWFSASPHDGMACSVRGRIDQSCTPHRTPEW